MLRVCLLAVWLGWSLTSVAAPNSSSSKTVIYECPGEKGRPLYSDRPCPDNTVHGNTPAHRAWRQMRQIVKHGKALDSERGPNVTDILACQEKQKALVEEVERMKRIVVKLPERYVELNEAAVLLEKCVGCGSSATFYCKKVDELLDQTIPKF